MPVKRVMFLSYHFNCVCNPNTSCDVYDGNGIITPAISIDCTWSIFRSKGYSVLKMH